MNKRLAFAISVIFIISTAGCSVPLTKAQSTSSIVINPDGSVTGTYSIEQVGNTYTLLANITGNIHVERSNIIINGLGYWLNGNEGTGITLNDLNSYPTISVINVTIENLYITNCVFGISSDGSGNYTFYDDDFSNCSSGAAIRLMDCSYNNISYCNFDSGSQISMDYSANFNIVTECNLPSNGVLVWLSGSENVDRNYWSDYLTVYPNATEVDYSGVGNTPYVFSKVNENGKLLDIYEDNHPLIKPVAVPLTSSNPELTDTIPVGYLPISVAYDSGKGELFVTNNGDNSVSIITDTNNTVVANVTVGSFPYGIAYDSNKNELFVTDANNPGLFAFAYSGRSNSDLNNTGTVSIISDRTNTVVGSIKVGSFPCGVAYDSGKNEIFVANQASGTVSVISDKTNIVIANITVGSQPFALVYDPARSEIFVTNYGGNTVSVISDKNNRVVGNINVGSSPCGIAYDTSKGEIFVTAVPGENDGFGTLSVISDSSNTIVANVTVGYDPLGVAYDSEKGEIFVANSNYNLLLLGGNAPSTVSVISDNNNSVISSITVGLEASGVAFDSSKDEIFVSNSYYSNSVSVISDSSGTAVSTSPTVPEFPSTLAILTLLIAVTISFAVIVLRQSRQGSHKIRSPRPILNNLRGNTLN
jgi:YVTN family beta-propeller protein